MARGLNVFTQKSLSDPEDPAYEERVRRYAGFYMDEDPQALNYDPRHKIIRSLFNGSRGPLLRKATAVDWAGDPIEVAHRFELGHGERSYEEMLAHFQDYNDIIGDHPQNLCATNLALNAYMLTGEEKYKQWLLEYVDAWVQRTKENGGIIPTNIGLDGRIGSACEGKWYGGVYGWGFSVKVPQTGELAHRNTHHLGLDGFGNAFLLTGDRRYLDVWRNMIEKVNSNSRIIDGVRMYPRMYGDQGWYAYSPQPYSHGATQLYYWSMEDRDRAKFPQRDWLAFLDGENPDFPERRLQADLATVRERIRAMRQDTTTPDTRLADDPMKYNPATVSSLIQLMLGGIHPGRSAGPLHCRVRYFDPDRRRAGLPDGVAALVTEQSEDTTTLTIVNISPTQPRKLLVQAGAYGEHQCETVIHEGRSQVVGNSVFGVLLEPGCGGSLTMKVNRYQNRPRTRLRAAL